MTTTAIAAPAALPIMRMTPLDSATLNEDRVTIQADVAAHQGSSECKKSATKVARATDIAASRAWVPRGPPASNERSSLMSAAGISRNIARPYLVRKIRWTPARYRIVQDRGGRDGARKASWRLSPIVARTWPNCFFWGPGVDPLCGNLKIRFPSVDAPFQARENVGVVAARGRMLSSVRPLTRQEDSRRPAWEFADRVQITRSVLEAQWKALAVPAPSRRLLRHTLLRSPLRPREWSAYAAAAGV